MLESDTACVFSFLSPRIVAQAFFDFHNSNTAVE